ncbi:YgiW/YdeI family stress tolerance OB fold protein [Roseateles amylovorans]|uniref:NirD/YgiW/YdeI family stress tolerance protein n=1 Tax=Roseateles amylovorans TaxID=2978473 RepID=A0ABY6B646_9BURK|nr:NirD/YgiW/YdeI family stress tolerance protein [Roseateles amylovorans]UXH80502.1 NirD/YgiW/YdeI family stress tolerance protein [Roseateles amylovorans]
MHRCTAATAEARTAATLSRRAVGKGAAALLGALFAGVSHAQYVGPTGLSLRTVKQLTEHGRDDEPARLRGRILSHDGGDHYTFADDTGRVMVEIDAHLFPPGTPIDDKRLVEITGELDRGFRSVKFDVKSMELVKASRSAALPETSTASHPAAARAKR